MLPRKLYELLPYIYIGVAILCAAAIDSKLVLLPSALLVTAGTLTLYMRHQARRNAAVMQTLQSGAGVRAAAGALSAGFGNRRSGDDRRQFEAGTFPLADYDDRLIAFDRRVDERRGSTS